MADLIGLVVDHVERRYWNPPASKRCWEGSCNADKEKDRIEELKRQAGDADAKPTRLYEAIENGLAELDDPNLKGRITELKRIRDAARADVERAEARDSKGAEITPRLLRGSPVNSAENRTFVRSFLSQLPASERGGMMDAAGNLSQAGVRRMEAAMASRAYGDGDFVARAFDAADPNIRGLAGGMVDASGPWMKMRQAARDGLIDPDHDVTPDLMNATRAVMPAREAGRPVSEVLNQGDMFGGETSALAKRLILNDKGNVASREQISARLQKYAGEAQKNLAGPGLFGDTVSPAQVLKTAPATRARRQARPNVRWFPPR
jgi:hypothetical protein